VSDPDYIVVRDPSEPSLHGKWFDKNELPLSTPHGDELGPPETYVPSLDIEVRKDGAVAQVYIPASNRDSDS